MADKGEVVAVLRVLDAGNTSSEFDHSKTELEVFPRFHHHNSVSFIGLCCEKGERIFVFEDMANYRMLHEADPPDPFPALLWEAIIEAYIAYYLDLNMQDLLAFPLQVAKLVRKGAQEARSFNKECWDLNDRVEKLVALLREILVARASTQTAKAVGLYERPTRRIMLEVVKALENALLRVRKCRSSMQLKRVATITTTIIFRKVNLCLDSSIGDVKWLLNISFRGDKRSDFSGLPPIASNDPVLFLVWEQVTNVHVGTAEEKADGAECLANLAKGNPARGVKIITKEGGAPPLLRLLKEGTITGQEAAATALEHLAIDIKGVRQLCNVVASSIFTRILGSHSTSVEVQLHVARLIAKFASLDKEAQSQLASQGAVRLLVALLLDQTNTVEGIEGPAASMVVRSNLTQLSSGDSSENGHNHALIPYSSPCTYSDAQIQPVAMSTEKDSEVRLGLMVEAAHALWKLAAGSIKNCMLITDTSALLCFAKLMKHGGGKQKYKSAMAVVEIAAAAECDPAFRQAAFATNSPSAKAIVKQLLGEITRENGEPELQESCCKAIGSLSRIFTVPAEVPIRALTSALANQNHDVIQVATEAASALSKFASNENNLHSLEHSKNIIGEGAVEHLVLLAYFHQSVSQLSALELLAYLALNVPDSEALARANVFHVLKSAIHANQLSHLFTKHETARALINDAIAKLEVCGYRSSSVQVIYG